MSREQYAQAIELVRKVARLNPSAGEIGAGKLAQLVAEARRVLTGAEFPHILYPATNETEY